MLDRHNVNRLFWSKSKEIQICFLLKILSQNLSLSPGSQCFWLTKSKGRYAAPILHCWEHTDQLHHRLVRQHFCFGPQTPAKCGKDCWEDHQDSTVLSAEHLPQQSPQESCLHPQRPHPPRSVKSKTTRLKNSFFPTDIRLLNSR